MPSSPPQRVVVDASAFLERLVAGRRGQAVEHAIGESQIVVPDHINVELLNALRGLTRSGQLTPQRAAEAVHDLVGAPLTRVGTTSLARRIWRRRENLSSYDAAYVALAQVLDCTLITGDGPLKRAVGDAVSVVLV